MRVTNASTYRNFTSSVNNVHLALVKSWNKVSSGEAYETAADSPLSYYEGKKIDNKYQDTLNKSNLIKDISNRVYQQELGARTIQDVLSKENGAKNQVRFARTDTTSPTALQTTMEDLMQKSQEIVDALNTEYEDFFVYGGNDYSNHPFTLETDLENDKSYLTFSHMFPGDDKASKVVFEMAADPDGNYKFTIDETQTESNSTPPKTGIDIIRGAMSEQGRIDIGYGSIAHRDTLVDTFTGGFNMLTGITSDSAKANPVEEDVFLEKLNGSALGLVVQSTHVINRYLTDLNSGADADRDKMHDQLGTILTEMTTAEQTISTVYADLGNKYSLLEDTTTKLNNTADSLKLQYKDILGADPYESIMEMYNSNYAYNAALKVGSQLMTSSLFDFVR